MSHPDLGVVLSGGGTSTAYTIGAVHALFAEHGVLAPGVMVMSSGGASVGCFGLARRFKEMYEWPRKFADPRCVSLYRFWQVWNIDYTVDRIMLAQVPGLGRKLGYSPTRLFISLCELPSGAVRWSSNEHLANIRNVLKASKAIPGVYGKEVEIEGKKYIDGSFGATLQDCVDKAFVEGAKKVIVIDVEGPAVTTLTALVLRTLSARQGRDVRAIVDSFIARRKEPIQASSNVIVLRPKHLPLRSAIDTHPVRTMQTILQGYADMKALKF